MGRTSLLPFYQILGDGSTTFILSEDKTVQHIENLPGRWQTHWNRLDERTR